MGKGWLHHEDMLEALKRMQKKDPGDKRGEPGT
jgi:hypothetical protein